MLKEYENVKILMTKRKVKFNLIGGCFIYLIYETYFNVYWNIFYSFTIRYLCSLVIYNFFNSFLQFVYYFHL